MSHKAEPASLLLGDLLAGVVALALFHHIYLLSKVVNLCLLNR